jgi:hypothetical protein
MDQKDIEAVRTHILRFNAKGFAKVVGVLGCPLYFVLYKKYMQDQKTRYD